jgi:multidrug efflux pump subunit AcrA (membrane-fusion protein)
MKSLLLPEDLRMTRLRSQSLVLPPRLGVRAGLVARASLLLLLFGAGCKGSTAASQEKESAAPVPVRVMRVQPGSISRQLTYDADVQGETEVKVFAQVAERIVTELKDKVLAEGPTVV